MTNPAICAFFRSAYGCVLRVSGDDAAGFLQGQFTQDLRGQAGTAVYGLWLNQKGKVVADSHVLRLGANEFLVASDRSHVATIQERLEQYIIADDVVLGDETKNFAAVRMWGEEAGARLRAMEGSAWPEPGCFAASEGTYIFPGRSGGAASYEWMGPVEKMDALQGQLTGAGFRRVDLNEADYVRIQARVPAIPDDIGLGDLPNEGGLEEVAISYTKGCYLGQEVMARLKNLGQVRRRLHVVRGTGTLSEPATPLYQGEKKVGELRSGASGPDGFLAWAMLSLVNFDPAAGLQLTPESPVTLQLEPHG